MRSETLKLAGTTTQDCADSVMRKLQNVKGVKGVVVVLDNSEVNIQFDEEVTSTQELQNVLTQAGYALSTKKSAHGENGSCCGSCGG